jgi:hypothetical protein
VRGRRARLSSAKAWTVPHPPQPIVRAQRETRAAGHVVRRPVAIIVPVADTLRRQCPFAVHEESQLAQVPSSPGVQAIMLTQSHERSQVGSLLV